MLKIHCQIQGSGTPIVLLHGFAMHSGIWGDFASQLAKNYRVICLDLPGHGSSDTVCPYSLDAIGSALLDAIDTPKFHLLGWSLGASVAIAMAAKTDRVQSLITLAANVHFAQSDTWPGAPVQVLADFAINIKVNRLATLREFLALQIVGKPQQKPQLTAIIQQMENHFPSQEVLQQALCILQNTDQRHAFASLPQKTLIIQAGQDRLIPTAVGKKMQQLKKNSRLAIINKAGHAPFLTHPKELLALVQSAV